MLVCLLNDMFNGFEVFVTNIPKYSFLVNIGWWTVLLNKFRNQLN